MAQNPNRVLDKTFLSLDLAEERVLIHRDYLAHCLRWSHVVKYLNQAHRFKEARVLDVGCGKEMPLAKLLYVNKMSPANYVGVDANKFDVPSMLVGKKIPITIWAETDFCTLDASDVSASDTETLLPNVVVSFEVLEHVVPSHCRRMLQHMRDLTTEDCKYFISTPCYNGSAAGNHVNEMTYQALGALFEDLGFGIDAVNGTFASISDYKDRLSPELAKTFNELREYYDTNVLSIIFAPLFPAESRNCLWTLSKHKSKDYVGKFPPLAEVPGPWTQHPRWRDLAGPAVEEAKEVA